MTEHDKCLMTNFFFCEATGRKLGWPAAFLPPCAITSMVPATAKSPPLLFFLTSAFQWIRKRGRTFRPQAFIRRLFISTDCFFFFFGLIGKLKFWPCRGYLMMTVNMNNTQSDFLRTLYAVLSLKK